MVCRVGGLRPSWCRGQSRAAASIVVGKQRKDAQESVKAGCGLRPTSFHLLPAPDNATKV